MGYTTFSDTPICKKKLKRPRDTSLTTWNLYLRTYASISFPPPKKTDQDRPEKKYIKLHQTASNYQTTSNCIKLSNYIKLHQTTSNYLVSGNPSGTSKVGHWMLGFLPRNCSPCDDAPGFAVFLSGGDGGFGVGSRAVQHLWLLGGNGSTPASYELIIHRYVCVIIYICIIFNYLCMYVSFLLYMIMYIYI